MHTDCNNIESTVRINSVISMKITLVSAKKHYTHKTAGDLVLKQQFDQQIDKK